MAEIRLEKKSNKTWIWWILGLLILGIIIWLLATQLGDDKAQTAVALEEEPTEAAEERNEAIEDRQDNPAMAFTNWWEGMDMTMGLDHEATHNGITALANALAYIAAESDAIKSQTVNDELQKMKQMADEITRNWKSTDHADKIKKAFIQASMVAESIQQASYPDMKTDIDNLKKEARDIDPQTLTLEQKESVKGFFAEANQVIHKMYKS